MIQWLISTAVGRIIGIVLASMLASGVLFAGCQVRGCMKAREELRQYQQAEKIRKEDKKIDTRSNEEKKNIDGYSSDDDFQRGFDRLRQYGADDED